MDERRDRRGSTMRGARLWRSLAIAGLVAALVACRVDAVSPLEPPQVGAPSPPPATTRSRVIAKLRLEETDPDAGRASQPDAAKKARIAAARDRLLASLPSAEVRLVRAYSSLPYVALEVSPAGLAALRASPLVASVEEDRVESIQGPDGGLGSPVREPSTR